MADETPKKDICITCACEVLETLRDAALSCDMAPLSALLQNALDEASRMQPDGGEHSCHCETGAVGLIDEMMKESEARQLLEFVSAVAMLDEDERARLASELENAQQNNLLGCLH